MATENRPTSTEVAANLKDSIKDKVVLITGCSPNGLGAETARAIATQSPGLIILAGRSKTAIEEAEAAIKNEIPSIKTRVLIFDLASLSSVRVAAAEVNAYPETIDVLVNNAATMAGPYEKTVDGFERQFGINHLGHFLLTNLLLKRIIQKGKSVRVINVTSNGYQFGGIRWEDPNFEREPYNKWAAYAQSKTANILFSIALASRLGSKGIYSFSAEVGGAIYTNISKHLTEEDFTLLANYPIQVLTKEEGTATQLAASFDPELEKANGAFLENTKPSEVKEGFEFAKGTENADKLWELSEKLVGEGFEW